MGKSKENARGRRAFCEGAVCAALLWAGSASEGVEEVDYVLIFREDAVVVEIDVIASEKRQFGEEVGDAGHGIGEKRMRD